MAISFVGFVYLLIKSNRKHKFEKCKLDNYIAGYNQSDRISWQDAHIAEKRRDNAARQMNVLGSELKAMGYDPEKNLETLESELSYFQEVAHRCEKIIESPID